MQKTPFNLDERIRVSPPEWPDSQLQVRPGDLSIFFKENQRHGNNPFQSAHPCEEKGGTVYFGNDIRRSDLNVLLFILGGERILTSDDYAVFTGESQNPKEDGYISQMRLVSHHGLQCGFNTPSEKLKSDLPAQDLPCSSAIWSFIECECARWGTYFGHDWKKGLRPLFLEDHNDTRVELSFGIAVESSYYGIFRLWSRGWLVSK